MLIDYCGFNWKTENSKEQEGLIWRTLERESEAKDILVLDQST